MQPLAMTRWLLLCVLTIIPSVQAQNFPPLTGRVVDQAQLLDQSQNALLSETLAAHEAQTSNQIVVATIPDLDGYAIADYANRLGRQWQIGTAENNNGVLLVVAPNERKVRIEVGYGLEGALTDALSSIIIQREILPAFRSNDYAGGINNGVNAIIQAIAGEYTVPAGSSGNSGRNDVPDALASFIPLIFIAMVAIPADPAQNRHAQGSQWCIPCRFRWSFCHYRLGQYFYRYWHCYRRFSACLLQRLRGLGRRWTSWQTWRLHRHRRRFRWRWLWWWFRWWWRQLRRRRRIRELVDGVSHT